MARGEGGRRRPGPGYPRRPLVLAGATVVSLSLLAACGTDAGQQAAATPTGEPVSTTTTTAPPTASTTTESPASAPAGLTAPEQLDQLKGWLQATATVRIDATLWEDGTRLLVEAEGSRGGGGSSRSVVRTHDGGRLELLVIGAARYVRLDDAYRRGIADAQSGEEERENPLLRTPHDGWYALPWEGEYEQLDRFRPHQLVQGNFFGEELTSWDVHNGAVSGTTLRGRPVWRLSVPGDSTSRTALVRDIYLAQGSDPAIVEMRYGTSPETSMLRFSGWNSTSDDFAPPSRPKPRTITNDQVDRTGLT